MADHYNVETNVCYRQVKITHTVLNVIFLKTFSSNVCHTGTRHSNLPVDPVFHFIFW